MKANHLYLLYKLQCTVTVTCVALGFWSFFVGCARTRGHFPPYYFSSLTCAHPQVTVKRGKLLTNEIPQSKSKLFEIFRCHPLV